MEEENGTISKNDEVWVKTKKREMGREGTVNSVQLEKYDIKHLKIKWLDSRKEDRFLIMNVSLNYAKQIVLVPTQQYYNGAYMEETVHYFSTKIR